MFFQSLRFVKALKRLLLYKTENNLSKVCESRFFVVILRPDSSF